METSSPTAASTWESTKKTATGPGDLERYGLKSATCEGLTGDSATWEDAMGQFRCLEQVSGVEDDSGERGSTCSTVLFSSALSGYVVHL